MFGLRERERERKRKCKRGGKVKKIMCFGCETGGQWWQCPSNVHFVSERERERERERKLSKSEDVLLY